MIDKPYGSKSIGLELEGSNLKAVKLILIKGKPKLESLYEMKVDLNSNSSLTANEEGSSNHSNFLNQSKIILTKFKEKTSHFFSEIATRFKKLTKKIDDVKPLDIETHNKEISQESILRNVLEETLNVSCLKGYQTIIRPLEIKLKKKSDIEATLAFQVEPLLPFPLDLAVVDRIELEETTDGTLLTILAAKKEHVKSHIQEWKNIRIEPEVISSEPSALISFSNHFIGDKTPYFIIYFGLNHVTCLLVKNGKLIASQSDLFEGDVKTNAELNKISLILYALSKQMRGAQVNDILFLGNATANEKLISSILQKLAKNKMTLTVDPNFNLSTSDLQKFAIPLGLSLNTLTKQKDLINFRQMEFAYPNPWKHLKTSLISYAFLSLFLALTFNFFSNAYLNYREDEIKTEYVNLLAGLNRPYRIFENEYLTKFPSESKNEDGQITPVKALSQQDLTERLNFLYKEIQASPDLFPLFPNIPRVSDVLAWLSNHPNIVKIDPVTNESTSLIQLESFSYSFLKRPEQTKKQEKYQVKVEFEFSTATPKLAREFHDALIAPNEIADPKGEIKWSSNRGKYKTSFFLKDKTIYPSARL